jgi:hypothetical protein
MYDGVGLLRPVCFLGLLYGVAGESVSLVTSLSAPSQVSGHAWVARRRRGCARKHIRRGDCAPKPACAWLRWGRNVPRQVCGGCTCRAAGRNGPTEEKKVGQIAMRGEGGRAGCKVASIRYHTFRSLLHLSRIITLFQQQASYHTYIDTNHIFDPLTENTHLATASEE